MEIVRFIKREMLHRSGIFRQPGFTVIAGVSGLMKEQRSGPAPNADPAELLPKKYAEVVRKELRDKLRNGELTKLVNGFVRRTGLVVFDPKVSGLEHSHHCGSMVM